MSVVKKRIGLERDILERDINQGIFLKIKVYWLIVCLGLPLGRDALAEEYQSHESIRLAIEQFVFDETGSSQDIESTISELDARLHLHACADPLRTFWPPGSRKRGGTSVGVACEDGKPWKIYVPVKISEFRNIAVVSRPLIRGDILEESDIKMERRDVSRLGQRFLTDYSEFLGYRVRQAASVGKVLQASLLTIPELVKRGEKVTLLASGGGIEIRMLGEALSNGVKGAVIRVRNINSKRIVEGEVVSKGVVQVRL